MAHDSTKGRFVQCNAIELDADGEVCENGFDNEEPGMVNAIGGPGSCRNCGFPRHGSRERCPAEGKTCNFCGAIGHFKNCCIKSRDSTRPVRTPAQSDHGAKMQRQTANARREIKRIDEEDDDSAESPDRGVCAAVTEDNYSKEELCAALSYLKRMDINKKKEAAKKKDSNEQSRYYTNCVTLQELGDLPFAHIKIGTSEKTVKALVDSGSAVSIIKKSLLVSLNIPYETEEFDGEVYNYSGDLVKTSEKAKLSLKLDKVCTEYRFVIAEGQVACDVTLGNDFMKSCYMSLINDPTGAYFSMGGDRIRCYTANDPVEGVNSVVFGPDLPRLELKTAMAVMLRGGDGCYLPVETEHVQQELQGVTLSEELTESGMVLDGQDCVFLQPNKAGNGATASLRLLFKRPKGSMITISKGTKAGYAMAYEEESLSDEECQPDRADVEKLMRRLGLRDKSNNPISQKHGVIRPRKERHFFPIVHPMSCHQSYSLC